MQTLDVKMEMSRNGASNTFPTLTNSTKGVSNMATTSLPFSKTKRQFHGYAHSVEYRIYHHRRARCEERQLPFCTSFTEFLDTVGDRPSEQHRLRRIDTTLQSWAPSNIEWGTRKTKYCAADNCNRELGVKQGRYCPKHAYRQRQLGDANTITSMGEGDTFEERFWSRVDKTQGLGRDGDCWEWGGKTFTEDGYGLITVKGKALTTHRIVWAISQGQWPTLPDLCVLHSCDNPKCVNPAHLRLGTNADNNHDRDIRGRTAIGERVGSAKLTNDLAWWIRFGWDGTGGARNLARSLGIGHSTLTAVRYNTTWKHLTRDFFDKDIDL